jgi:hypothetical protein
MSLLEFSERMSERNAEHSNVMCYPHPKKVRIDEEQDNEITTKYDSYPISVESMLSVPTDVIFRKVQNKPLLTRAEGQCFLRIAMLAHELDASIDLSERILLQQRQSRELRHKMDDFHNPTLRSLTILIRVFESQLTPALVGVQKALSGVMMELSSCSSVLRQSAEQNWSVTESILDAMAGTLAGHSSRVLARDKRNMAELEEELAKRIDGLLVIASLDFPEERRRTKQCEEKLRTRRYLFGGKDHDGSAIVPEPLKDVCSRLFSSGSEDIATVNGTSMRPLTQPDDFRSRNSQQSSQNMDGDEEESIVFDMEESQNSFRRRSTAAETLANLSSTRALN